MNEQMTLEIPKSKLIRKVVEEDGTGYAWFSVCIPFPLKMENLVQTKEQAYLFTKMIEMR